MDEFDIYLESTGSMETYQNNRMASFRNVLSEPIQLEGDWRVALAEIIFPTSIKNVTTTDYLIYTPRTPYDTLPVSANQAATSIIKQEDWSSNATFPEGEYKSVADILKVLKKGTQSKKPLEDGNISDDNFVELKFADGHGISVQDRSILDVLGFEGIIDKNRGGYFIGSNKKVRETSQPIRGEYPADITAGTNIFFIYCNIIEHQKIAGIKAPVLRVIDTKRKLKDGDLFNSSSTTHKSFSELQFKKLVLTSIREVFIELVTPIGKHVPFVGTGRVVIALKFRKF